MAVFGLNLPVFAVDQQFSALVLGNFPCPVNSVRLTVEQLCGALGASPFYSPSFFPRDYVLIAFGHVGYLCHSGTAAHMYVRQRIETRTK